MKERPGAPGATADTGDDTVLNIFCAFRCAETTRRKATRIGWKGTAAMVGVLANRTHVEKLSDLHPIDRVIEDLPNDDVLTGAVQRSSVLLNQLEINDAMADLAPKHREIINLTFFEGLSLAEIRAKLDLTEGQYRNRRRQAHKEMGELLEARGHGH